MGSSRRDRDIAKLREILKMSIGKYVCVILLNSA